MAAVLSIVLQLNYLDTIFKDIVLLVYKLSASNEVQKGRDT
jgi:hypothetical protein